MDEQMDIMAWNMKDNGLTLLSLGSRQANPQPIGDCRLQVCLRQPGPEAQGHQRGMSRPYHHHDSTPNPLPQVNPEIVGGLVVEIGDRTIDLSVSSRIAKMNKLLTDSL